MQIIRNSEELAKACGAARAAGTLALVPTMGALHAGHLKLVEVARQRAHRVLVSIFVNPLQFAANEDLGRYPRQEEEDARLLQKVGCDILWLPSVGDLYPDGFATSIHVAGVSAHWEGSARPGHFDGVATVVAKLFAAVSPDLAIFGEKDFQQLAVIRRMTADLGFPVEIVGVPIVRDRDGLALSSRNAYLSPEQRDLALGLPVALEQARDAIRAGTPVGTALTRAKQHLLDSGFLRIDYVALVDAGTLEPIDTPRAPMRLIAAASMGTTRLIDNLEV